MSGNGNGRLGEAEYADLVARVQATVAATVPPGATVLVVSKGDAALVEMAGVQARHFPQDEAGGYAGHHPRDSVSATAQLEELRRRGAEYLVIPVTARWWLDFYDGFATHLATHGELLVDAADACLVYRLAQLRSPIVEAPELTRPRASVDQIRDFLENLISNDARVVVLEAGDGVAAGLAPITAAPLTAGRGEEGLIARLRGAAEAGAEYLIVPRTTDEWMERNTVVAREIETSCRKVADQRHLCRVFELKGLREEQ